jgi:hypothetical protein
MEAEKAKERSEEATSKRYDVMSQLLSIVQTKGEKINFTYQEVISEMWTGV